MNQLRRLMRATNLSSAQLSEAMGIPIRTLSYHYTTGRMPFALVYKLHLVTGLTLEELVPKFLADNWLFLYEEQNKANKPRGKVKRNWESPPMDTLIEDPLPPVSRETPNKIPAELKKNPITPAEAIKPKVPKKKSSIADLMKAAPPQSEPEPDTPDFSGLDDSIFGTSMDVANNPIRKKR